MKVLSFLPLFFLTVLVSPLNAEIHPASIFGDHMVLQRDLPIPVWGTADPGETVTVELAGQKAVVQAGADGKWMVRLPARSATEGLEMRITGSATATSVAWTDVAVGEVWICSGQSNMEFPLKRSINGEKEVAEANHPKIRLFRVGHNTPWQPATAVQGQWQPCTPESVADFSAVGYFFGRDIQPYIGVPVGLIETSWGGTPAEAWTRLGVLDNDPDYANLLKTRAEFQAKDSPEEKQKVKQALMEWTAKIDQLLKSPGTPNPVWFDPAADLKEWKPITEPGFWEAQINLQVDGSVWLRKVIDVPAAFAAGPATLSLGSVDDFDFTWVNGQLVGHTGKEIPMARVKERHYELPAGVLKKGRNVILVRAIDEGRTGGIGGKPEMLQLSNASGATISLVGAWQYWVEKNLGKAPEAPRVQNVAGVLYDGMVAPLVPYGIRGVIWYQGESNAGRAVQYTKLFPAMIANWRQDWGQGDFPFYFVQLANFMKANPEPGESSWAEVREAQFKTLSVPHTGMAVIIDIGEADDIHPKNKQDVGKRLALWALAQNYGMTQPSGFLGKIPGVRSFFQKPIIHSGPLYKGMKVEGSSIRVSFDHVGGGLVSQKGPLKGFAIAGDDRKFVWAEASIAGDAVVVHSPQVSNPVAVRYDWANNPDGNLYNVEGLPASPFRTDDWSKPVAGKN